MNNLDHISKSLETIFGVKNLRFFHVDPPIWDGKISDPGWKKVGFRSGISIPDPQQEELFFFEGRHCVSNTLFQINVLEKTTRDYVLFCSSAETSCCVCGPPSQCPRTGESEVFFFEWRHCLSTSRGDIACQIPSTKSMSLNE
jgi:hypothetical protein